MPYRSIWESQHKMAGDVYERLADALDRLPNGFPRTESKVEIAILKKIFSPEEAAIASQLSGRREPLDAIVARVGLSVQEAGARLGKMAESGLVWFDQEAGKPRFRLAPFIVGIYEAQLDRMDHELAHLVEDYLANGGAVGIMKPQPALHRVLPAQRAVKSEWILPYDDVREILLSAKTFGLRDCICRVQQDHLGHHCDFPTRSCLFFTPFERAKSPVDVSREEALAALDKFEEIGLVHTVSNVIKGVGYVCNCCGCCCGILRGINDFGIEDSVAQANYFAVIDPEECLGCGTCIDRCQVHAISDKDGVSVVDRKRCIGCGLCVTGCPNNVAKLQRKPGSESVEPPADFSAWSRQRLLNRGLIK
ncbi:4Fe-4S binding protein [Candidatus Bathyarchaeota archaeon]|nr:4Fe-4S binding protein [Candidatus Bathyarchaeota archaeon]